MFNVFGILDIIPRQRGAMRIINADKSRIGAARSFLHADIRKPF